MDYIIATLEAAFTKATAMKTALALSKLRLFQSTLIPTAFTTKAQLVAAEATFDGYTAGGYALTAWTGPLNGDTGGAVITSPLVPVAYGPPGTPPVGNSIGGYWVEDATGEVRLVAVYSPARNLSAVGQGWPIVVQDVEGVNAPIPTGT